jgi:hypothetical protein
MNQFKSRCQCLESCKNKSLPGEAFCQEHLKFCPRKPGLNNSAPPYEPDRWNRRKEVRLTHNCFSYAFNLMDPKQILKCLQDPECDPKSPDGDCQGSCDVPFHQPGSVSGYPRFSNQDPKTCPNMTGRIFGDNPSVDKATTAKASTFEGTCPEGSSKIALIVDEKQDYHFLRQDDTGFFSQKSGAMPVTNLDSAGHKIYDVPLAYHYYPRRNDDDPLNYDRFCGYFCVPRDQPLHAKIGGFNSKLYANPSVAQGQLGGGFKSFKYKKYRFTKKAKKGPSRRSSDL